MSATLKCKSGDVIEWWMVVAFSELMWLSDGDAISVQCAPTAETYEKDGVAKFSLSVIAEQELPLRQPPRKSERLHQVTARGEPFMMTR